MGETKTIMGEPKNSRAKRFQKGRQPMNPKECKRLADVYFPIAEVSRHSAREKSIRHGHSSTSHLWWARRPLAACRAMLLALLLPDPCDDHCPKEFIAEARWLLLAHHGRPEKRKELVARPEGLRKVLLDFIADFANWDNAANPEYLKTSRALVRAVGSFASDQGIVWQEIDARFARMAEAPSPTRAVSDLYERHQEMTEDFLKAFSPVDNQIGMIVFIDGEVAGIEFLWRFETFKKNHSKLVHSYAMDALETLLNKEKSESKASKARASEILESAAKASVEKRKSVALGEDVRLESREVVGAGLDYEGHILQLTIFPNDETDELNGTRKTVRKASERRRSWGRSQG